jgi:hypothetical protein
MRKLQKIRKFLDTNENSMKECCSFYADEIQKILGKPKLFAIVHDGSFDGDNTFYCPDDRVEFKEGQNIRDIRQAYHEKRVKADVGDQTLTPEEVREVTDMVNEDYTSQIKGAWIVDEDGLKAIEGLYEHITPGNDSACYALNRAAKSLAHSLALRYPGRKPR